MQRVRLRKHYIPIVHLIILCVLIWVILRSWVYVNIINGHNTNGITLLLICTHKIWLLYELLNFLTLFFFLVVCFFVGFFFIYFPFSFSSFFHWPLIELLEISWGEKKRQRWKATGSRTAHCKNSRIRWGNKVCVLKTLFKRPLSGALEFPSVSLNWNQN